MTRLANETESGKWSDGLFFPTRLEPEGWNCCSVAHVELEAEVDWIEWWRCSSPHYSFALRKSTGGKREHVFTLYCIQTLWNESIDSLIGILERWKLFYRIKMDWSCDFFGQCSVSGGGGVHFLSPSESVQDAAKLGLAYCWRREEVGVSQAFQSTGRSSATYPIHSNYRWMREVSGDQDHPAEPSLCCWHTGFELNKELGFVIVVF